MSDITKCTNLDCVMKIFCKRYTCEPNKFRQPYNKFKPKINESIIFKCDYFIRDEKTIKNK